MGDQQVPLPTYSFSKTKSDNCCHLEQHFSTAGTSPGNGTKKVCSGTKNLSEIRILFFYSTKQVRSQTCFETVCFSQFFYPELRKQTAYIDRVPYFYQ